MVTIRLQENKVLLSDNKVAASERCLCLCSDECLSITFAGFGPAGDPCVECGNLNGTYVLHRRPIIRPWGFGPWTYSYCGDAACPPANEEDPPLCLEIVLVLSCSQHQLTVSLNGTVILTAQADYDGTPCDELAFTNIAGETCDPVGTISTGSTTCDEIPETRCCECPPCGTPTEWAIVDLTSGWEVLASGSSLYGYALYGIPSFWRTRCWFTAEMPTVITLGLFVYSYPAQNPDECGVYLPVDIWQVFPKKCSGGAWWDTHAWQESYPGISCEDPPEPMTTEVTSAPDGPYVMNQFGACYNDQNYNQIGCVDCEWTNMANWTEPSFGQYQPACRDRDLPDSTVDVSVSNNLLGNALGVANVKNLTVFGGASVGIHITVAETATIDGTIIRGCSTPCDPGCCEPQDMGWIDAVGNVTLGSGGLNRGKISSDDTVTVEGINNGGLIEAATKIEFTGTSGNFGFLSAPNIHFRDTATNHDPVPWTDCEWVVHLDPAIQGSVEFHDESTNYGGSFSGGYVVFRDDSSNAVTAKVSSACQFLGNAVNYGEVGDGSEFGQAFEPGSPTRKNAASGIVNGSAVFYGENYGTVRGNASFYGAGRNYGTVEGDGDFSDSGENNAGGDVFGNATFGGTGWNYGVVRGDAVFDGDSVNYGTVNGNATFNGNSSNLGTVLGTITCNTTGTC